MAKKLKNLISRPRSVSGSSSDNDGVPIYTPPESESNESLSGQSFLPDPTHLSEVIHGLQNVKLAQGNFDDSEQQEDKDISVKKKRGKKYRPKETVPSDIAVSNVTNTFQNLAVSDREAGNLEQDRINARHAKNRREKERKKRKKARKAEEDAKEANATSANEKSNYSILKDAGYRGMNHFMASHGLRLHDHQDIDIAKQMVKRMGEDMPGLMDEDMPGLVDEEVEPEAESGWGGMERFMIARGLKWGDIEELIDAKELFDIFQEGQAESHAEQMRPPKKENTQGVKKVEDASTKPKIAKTKKKAVVGLWEDYFGNETQLANWQRLCVDVGMEEIPTSITKCRKALGKVWVNIFDFLDAKAEGKPVKRYKSEQELAAYTMNSGKIYPKKQAKQGGPARVLLAHIFRH